MFLQDFCVTFSSSPSTYFLEWLFGWENRPGSLWSCLGLSMKPKDRSASVASPCAAATGSRFGSLMNRGLTDG